MDGAIPTANATKINDESGKNRVVRRELVSAKALFDGVANSLVYADGGVVTKQGTGSYKFEFNTPFSNANSYVAIAQGSTSSINTGVPILISPTANKSANFVVFSCYRADTGAAVDIPQISFIAYGQ